jgi:hypothetical protein
MRFFGRLGGIVAVGLLGLLVLVLGPNDSGQAADGDASMLNMKLIQTASSTVVDLQPGQKFNGQIRVQNDGDQPFRFKVYAMPFQVLDESYQNFDFETTSTRNQIVRWVSFPQTEYTAAVGQTLDVPYQIDVPASIPDGGQYAVIFAQTLLDEATEKLENSVKSTVRLGQVIYGHPPGETIDKAEIVERRLGGWQQTTPLTTMVRLKNAGNTDFELQYQLTVNDALSNQEVYSSSSESVRILPETTRRIEMNWSQAPMIGWFRVTQKLSYLNETDETSRLVLIMPIWPIVGLGLVVVTVVGSLLIRHWLRRPKTRNLPETRRRSYLKKPSRRQLARKHRRLRPKK